MAVICALLLIGLITCIGILISKNGEIKRLKDYSRFLNDRIKQLTIELDRARRLSGTSGAKTGAPAPQNPEAAASMPAAAMNAAMNAVPGAGAPAQVARGAQGAQRPFVPAPGQAGAPHAAVPNAVPNAAVPQYTYYNNQNMRPAGYQQAPSYQMQQRPVKEKTPISSINISFGVGVLLMTIVGAVFISSSWGSMSDVTRATVLIGAVAVVYLLSLLSGKILKLRQTGFAFFTLGSLLMPVVITGIGAMGLWGPAFSFKDGNGFLVGAVAALFLGAAGLAGSFIYKSGAYNGITYFGFTWTLMFTAAQMGSDAKERFLFAFLAIAFTALVCRLVLLSEFGRNIKYFKLYADIMFWIGTCLAFIVEFTGEAYICAGIAAIAVAVFLKIREGNPNFRYLLMALCLAIPVSLTSWFGAAYMTTDSVRSEIGWEGFAFFILTSVLIGASYVAFDKLKYGDIVSDIVYPVFMVMFSLWYNSILITDDYVSTYVLLAGCVLCCAAFWRAALRSGYKEAAKNIFSAAASAFSFGAFLIGSVLMFWERDDLISLVITVIVALAVSAVMVMMVGRRRTYPSIVTYFVLALIGSIVLKEAYDKTWNYFGAVLMTVSFIPVIAATFIKFGKKDKVLVSAVILTTMAVLSLYGSISVFFETHRMPIIIYTSILLAAVAAAGLPAVKANKKAASYANVFYYILSVIGILQLAAYSLDHGRTYEMIVLAALYAAASYFNRKTVPSIVTLMVLGWNAGMFVKDTGIGQGICTLIFAGAVALYLIAGRLIHRKEFIKGGYIDAFTPSSLIFLTLLPVADYTSLVVFALLAGIVLNLAGRVKLSSKVIYSISLSLLFLGFITQSVVDLPGDYAVEIRLALLLIDVLLIRYVIKPGNDKAVRYIWFTAVAFSLAAEAISAASTGYITDLLFVGITSAGIFIYSFLKKAKLWFVLSVVAIIGIAVYLSLTFWGSGVWTLYLLAAGILLISMAAYNEYCKRKAAESGSDRKKRFFEEWTW